MKRLLFYFMDSIFILNKQEYDNLNTELQNAKKQIRQLTENGEYFSLFLHVTPTSCGEFTRDGVEGFTKDEVVLAMKKEIERLRVEFARLESSYRNVLKKPTKKWPFLLVALMGLIIVSCSKPRPTVCYQCQINNRIYLDTVTVCQDEYPVMYNWDRTTSKCWRK